MKTYRDIIKPICDVSVSVVLLIVLSPFIIIISLILFWLNKGSVFFLQQRPGRFGKPFVIIKFKTMRDEADENGKPLPDELRLTAPGRFIRSFSLDEVLQLINVVKGDMSIVGPRPLLMQYLDLYTPEQLHRHDVKPGITGWAQVNGRNAISWEQKFELDLYYVAHQSFYLDFRILLKTCLNIVMKKGVSSDGHATMEEFRGSSKQSI